MYHDTGVLCSIQLLILLDFNCGLNYASAVQVYGFTCWAISGSVLMHISYSGTGCIGKYCS